MHVLEYVAQLSIRGWISESMSSFIVEDFDLYHCSIALTVTQELNFDFDASEETKVLLILVLTRRVVVL